MAWVFWSSSESVRLHSATTSPVLPSFIKTLAIPTRAWTLLGSSFRTRSNWALASPFRPSSE